MRNLRHSVLAVVALACSSCQSTAPVETPAQGAPAVAADGLAGVITQQRGEPLAGAWVTAIAADGEGHVRHTVLSRDDGSYRLAGLSPGASYRVRVRVYGYADHWVRNVSPGRVLSVQYGEAQRLSAAETAAQYPSNYWLSLMKPPPDTVPPVPGAPTPSEWTTNVIYNCAHCHQIGTPVMRYPRTRAQWSETFHLSARTEFSIRRLGRDRVLDLFTAWSDRLRAGALPEHAPARPTGAAAAYRLTEWEVGGPLTWFREVAAGHNWNPSVGAAAPKGATGKWVYTADVAWGTLVGVNIETGEQRRWQVPHGSLVWPYGSWSLFHMTSAPITLQVDAQGKIVIVALVTDDTPPGVLSEGVVSLVPLLPPLDDGRKYGGNHQLIVFDPRTEQWEPVTTPCDTHGLTVARDGKYWLTRQEDKICSYDPAQKKAVGYPWPAEWGKGIVGGNDVSADDKVWFFFTFTFSKQDTLAMFDATRGEFKRWTIPAPARLPRHVCLDSTDRPYMLLQSGHLGRFDPKTEQFKIWELPEARLGAGDATVNLGFSCVVDKEGAAGVKDAVYISGNLSDSIIAFHPATESFVNYRMPGHFYTKDLEIYDGAVWAMLAENPEKYLEPDPATGVALPRLIRLDPRGQEQR